MHRAEKLCLCLLSAAFGYLGYSVIVPVPTRPTSPASTHQVILCEEFTRTTAGMKYRDPAGAWHDLEFLTPQEAARQRLQQTDDDSVPQERCGTPR